MSTTVHTRKELKIDCSKDPGTPATFLCARCKRPFCESCVGIEEGRKVYCLTCTVLEEAKLEEQHRQDFATKLSQKIPKSLVRPLSIILSLLIVIGLYFVALPHFDNLFLKPLPPLTESQEKDMLKCKTNLESLSLLLAQYQVTKQRDPQVLEDVIVQDKDRGLLIEPVDDNEYGLETRPGLGLVIACPNPDEHNLYDLYAPPGNPAYAVKERD